jgi:Domain of unknown function (DUF4398)
MIVARSWIAALASLSMMGCVETARAPELGRAEAALYSAQEIAAPEDPEAAYYLDLASRELARGRALERIRDVEGARGWAQRAQADADVARMLAVEATARSAAQRTEDDAMALERAIEAGR